MVRYCNHRRCNERKPQGVGGWAPKDLMPNRNETGVFQCISSIHRHVPQTLIVHAAVATLPHALMCCALQSCLSLFVAMACPPFILISGDQKQSECNACCTKGPQFRSKHPSITPLRPLPRCRTKQKPHLSNQVVKHDRQSSIVPDSTIAMRHGPQL